MSYIVSYNVGMKKTRGNKLLTVRLTSELRSQAEKFAGYYGSNLSVLVRDVLDAFVSGDTSKVFAVQSKLHAGLAKEMQLEFAVMAKKGGRRRVRST